MIVGIGVEVTFEVIKAIELLYELEPALRIRMVNVTDLMVLSAETTHPHALGEKEFTELFTEDQSVLFNYHGYATELQGLLFGRPQLQRMQVHGYREECSTTTPFDMLLRNGVSRYDVAKRALCEGAKRAMAVANNLERNLGEIKQRVASVTESIYQNGKGKLRLALSLSNPLGSNNF